LSDSLLAISLWRGIIAASYAVATIACQEYAFRSAAEGTGTRAAGAFVAVVYAGVFCGSALGGVIASRLGFAAAFYTGGAIAVVSGAIAMMIMAGRAGDPMTPTRLVYEGPAETGSFTPYFLALLGGIVVPMNATTALFIWYLTPLMLAASGYGPAEIARVVMLYYLAVVVVGPIVSRLSDGRLGPVPLIIFGPVVSGLALLSLAFWGSVWAVAVAVAAVGIGHALIRAPQYVLAPRLAASHRGLNALRLVERLGALLGLVLGAISLGGIGASSTLRVLGFVVLTGVALFVIIERIQRHR
jgi:predicted MFS family arabinose efflux permease